MAGEGRGERTRRTIVDAAERLIAREGLAGLSLRQVAVAAGQRNHSAVQYHFGSRDGLVAAVFEARMAPIDSRRAELLAHVEGSGRQADLPALCDVATRPLAEAVLVEPPGWYGRFLAQISRSAPELLSMDHPGNPSLRRTATLLVGAMVEVPVELRGERLTMALRGAVQVLADLEQSLADGRMGVERPLAVQVAQVVDLVHAVVASPPIPALTEQLDASRRER